MEERTVRADFKWGKITPETHFSIEERTRIWNKSVRGARIRKRGHVDLSSLIFLTRLLR